MSRPRRRRRRRGAGAGAGEGAPDAADARLGRPALPAIADLLDAASEPRAAADVRATPTGDPVPPVEPAGLPDLAATTPAARAGCSSRCERTSSTSSTTGWR